MTREERVACGLVVVFALVACLTSGCGASAVTQAARGVDVTSQLLAPAMSAAVHVRGAELDACDVAPAPLDCLDAGERAWAPRILEWGDGLGTATDLARKKPRSRR